MLAKGAKLFLFFIMICTNLITGGCLNKNNAKEKIQESEAQDTMNEQNMRIVPNKNGTNILYVFADQLSLLALEIYGNKNEAKTPNIDYLAQNGVRFTNSYCSTPQCSPSRSSMLTGLLPHKTEVVGNAGTKGTKDLKPSFTSIGNYFKEKGYSTAYFGKWHLGGNEDSVQALGFEQVGQISGGGADAPKTQEAIKFLREYKSEKPWLTIISYNEPHNIYEANKRMKANFPLDTKAINLPDSFSDDLMTKPVAQRMFRDDDQGRPLKDFTEEDWKYYVAWYNYSIESLDSELGKVLDVLRETGQFENTLIIFSSDHGDMMAAHRMPFKGPMMYSELIKVPMIFSWPGIIPQNQVRDQLTVNTDLFPTICDLLGYDVPENLDGISMKDSIFNPDAKSREYMILQYYSKQKWVNPIRTIIKDDLKYNLYLTGEEELYDLKKDRSEVNNLANDVAYDEQREQLKQQLLSWIKEHKDPFFEYKNTGRQGEIIN